MPGVVAAAAWTLYALVRGKRTTCSAARAIAARVPGGRWLLAAAAVWWPLHLCRPLFRRPGAPR